MMKSINLLKAKEVAAAYMILAAGERGPRVPLQELVKDLRELTLEMYSKMEEYEIETCLEEIIGRSEGAWISVNDRLPGHNKRIVMHCKYPACSNDPILGFTDYICVGVYAANGVWYEISDWNHCLTNHAVDYWMPLPETPKESDAE